MITARLEAHAFGARCDQPVRELLTWPIGVAGDAVAIAAAGAQLIEQRRSVRFLGHDDAEYVGWRRNQGLSPERGWRRRSAAAPWRAAGAVTLGFRVSPQTSP